MEKDENSKRKNSFWSTLILLFQILIIGILYAFGGMGWAKKFTTDKRKINIVGVINTIIPIILLIVLLITLNNEPPESSDLDDYSGSITIIVILIIHTIVTLIGLVMYINSSDD